MSWKVPEPSVTSSIRLQHLICLNLSDCTGLNDDGARALARLSSRPGALLLHTDNSTLVLVGCTSLTSTGLSAFSEGTPKSGQLHLPDVDEDVLECAHSGHEAYELRIGAAFLVYDLQP